MDHFQDKNDPSHFSNYFFYNVVEISEKKSNTHQKTSLKGRKKCTKVVFRKQQF